MWFAWRQLSRADSSQRSCTHRYSASGFLLGSPRPSERLPFCLASYRSSSLPGIPRPYRRLGSSSRFLPSACCTAGCCSQTGCVRFGGRAASEPKVDEFQDTCDRHRDDLPARLHLNERSGVTLAEGLILRTSAGNGASAPSNRTVFAIKCPFREPPHSGMIHGTAAYWLRISHTEALGA